MLFCGEKESVRDKGKEGRGRIMHRTFKVREGSMGGGGERLGCNKI